MNAHIRYIEQMILAFLGGIFTDVYYPFKCPLHYKEKPHKADILGIWSYDGRGCSKIQTESHHKIAVWVQFIDEESS